MILELFSKIKSWQIWITYAPLYIPLFFRSIFFLIILDETGTIQTVHTTKVLHFFLLQKLFHAWEGKNYESPSHETKVKITLEAWSENMHESHSMRKQQCMSRLRNSMGFMYQTMILLGHLKSIWDCFTLSTERFVPLLVEPKPNLGFLKENEEDKWKAYLPSSRLPLFHTLKPDPLLIKWSIPSAHRKSAYL